mgnify:CR=1 FL=1
MEVQIPMSIPRFQTKNKKTSRFVLNVPRIPFVWVHLVFSNTVNIMEKDKSTQNIFRRVLKSISSFFGKPNKTRQRRNSFRGISRAEFYIHNNYV